MTSRLIYVTAQRGGIRNGTLPVIIGVDEDLNNIALIFQPSDLERVREFAGGVICPLTAPLLIEYDLSANYGGQNGAWDIISKLKLPVTRVEFACKPRKSDDVDAEKFAIDYLKRVIVPTLLSSAEKQYLGFGGQTAKQIAVHFKAKAHGIMVADFNGDDGSADGSAGGPSQIELNLKLTPPDKVVDQWPDAQVAAE